MEIYSFIVAFFRDGGFFLYPMAAVFVAGIAIAIERWVFLNKARAENRKLWAKVLPLLAAGKVRPLVHATFPLAEAAKAHALMESSAHIGKIVLLP